MISQIANTAWNGVKMFFQCVMEARQMRADMMIRQRGYIMQDGSGKIRYIGR